MNDYDYKQSNVFSCLKKQWGILPEISTIVFICYIFTHYPIQYHVQCSWLHLILLLVWCLHWIVHLKIWCIISNAKEMSMTLSNLIDHPNYLSALSYLWHVNNDEQILYQYLLLIFSIPFSWKIKIETQYWDNSRFLIK